MSDYEPVSMWNTSGAPRCMTALRCRAQIVLISQNNAARTAAAGTACNPTGIGRCKALFVKALAPLTISLFGDAVASCLWVRSAVDAACSNQNSICPAKVAPHGFGTPATYGIGRAQIEQ